MSSTISGLWAIHMWTYHPYSGHARPYQERADRPVTEPADQQWPIGAGHLAGNLPVRAPGPWRGETAGSNDSGGVIGRRCRHVIYKAAVGVPFQGANRAQRGDKAFRECQVYLEKPVRFGKS